jgi:succinyl-diaminopimelate desuccinylase
MPFLGISAIDGMARFIGKLEGELRPKLTARLTAMPVEPPGARRPSLNINGIGGGQPYRGIQTPCVADRCSAVFDRRFIMEEPFADVRAEIQTILEDLRQSDKDFHYRLEDLMIVEPVVTAAESKLVRTMSGAVASVLSAQPPLIASPGTYDQKHVMRKGLVDQCIAYGPGILHLSHQPDEYCRIDHLIDAAKAMALAAMRLLGTAQ